MLHLFMKGGPLMWPLLLTSLIALTTVFERILAAIREQRSRRPADLRSMVQELRDDNREAAAAIGSVSPDFRARCLAASLRKRDLTFAAAYQHHAGQELRRAARGLPILDTVITLAPLLGLLGTVTGMIHAFGLMGASELDAPVAITGGVAEALIATAFGLGIAIAALIPFNWLNTRMERIQHELQDIGSQVEPLIATMPSSDALRHRATKPSETYAAARS